LVIEISLIFEEESFCIIINTKWRIFDSNLFIGIYALIPGHSALELHRSSYGDETAMDFP